MHSGHWKKKKENHFEWFADISAGLSITCCYKMQTDVTHEIDSGGHDPGGEENVHIKYDSVKRNILKFSALKKYSWT